MIAKTWQKESCWQCQIPAQWHIERTGCGICGNGQHDCRGNIGYDFGSAGAIAAGPRAVRRIWVWRRISHVVEQRRGTCDTEEDVSPRYMCIVTQIDLTLSCAQQLKCLLAFQRFSIWKTACITLWLGRTDMPNFWKFKSRCDQGKKHWSWRDPVMWGGAHGQTQSVWCYDPGTYFGDARHIQNSDQTKLEADSLLHRMQTKMFLFLLVTFNQGLQSSTLSVTDCIDLIEGLKDSYTQFRNESGAYDKVMALTDELMNKHEIVRLDNSGSRKRKLPARLDNTHVDSTLGKSSPVQQNSDLQ